MYSLLTLPNSICYLLSSVPNGLQDSQGRESYKSCSLNIEYYEAHWLEISRVAAEAVELLKRAGSCVDEKAVTFSECFPIQGLVYSLLSLLEDQALKLLGD